MGDLTNKQISATYDGLIKTSDEQPIDGNLKTLQDGVGNNLPIEVSTTGVNFTGNVTGIPDNDTTYTLDKSYIGSAMSINLNGSDASLTSVGISPGTDIDFVQTAAGIRIDSTAGGGGGLYNQTYMQRFSPTSYNNYGPATNFMVSQPLIGDIVWQNAIDGNDSTTIFAKFYARPGTSVTEVAFIASAMTTNQDYTVAFYDSYANGMPKDLINQEVIPVTLGADRWITTTLTTPLQIVAGNEYWFGIKTNYGTGNIRNTVGRQRIASPVGTILDLNNPNEGFLGNNSLYFNGTLPGTFPNGQGFGTRDEAIILMYR